MTIRFSLNEFVGMQFEVSSTIPVMYGKFMAAIQNAKLKPTTRTGYNFVCEFGTVTIVENSLNNTLKIDAVTTAHHKSAMRSLIVKLINELE